MISAMKHCVFRTSGPLLMALAAFLFQFIFFLLPFPPPPPQLKVSSIKYVYPEQLQ
jgi:hypothetical protein